MAKPASGTTLDTGVAAPWLVLAALLALLAAYDVPAWLTGRKTISEAIYEQRRWTRWVFVVLAAALYWHLFLE